MPNAYRCEWCGDGFKAKREATYCSAACRSKAWKDAREKALEHVPRWSGAQVAYQKLVRALRERPDDDPIDVVNDCVSVRQRAQLHAREQRRAA
jgi:hypothetical protein